MNFGKIKCNPFAKAYIKPVAWLMPVAIMLVILVSCAKTGTLTGGEEDIAPPEMVDARPDKGATNVTPKTIEITFDEFLQLKNIQQELVVSPPLEYRPEIELRNKSVVIEIKDTLQENTTYSFNFGNAITDFREGNVLPNFVYAFSTGNYLDSLAITGRVLQAFNLLPLPKDEQVTILVYKNLSDTAFKTVKPFYVGRADENGYFSVPYMQKGNYNVFALTDNNRSYKYDGDGEKIAFMDSAFALMPESFPRPDTTDLDSIWNAIPDSLGPDSLKPAYNLAYALHVQLLMFEEDNKPLLLSKIKRDERRQFTVYFNKPHPLTVEVKIALPVNDDALIEDISARRDTFKYWIADSNLYARDSIPAILQYYKTDSLGNDNPMMDTVQLVYIDRQPRRRKPEQIPDTLPPEPIALNKLGSKTQQDLHQPLKIAIEAPIKHFTPDSFQLSYLEDTIWQPQPFTLKQNNLYQIELLSEWLPGAKYKVLILPNAVVDIYNGINDSTTFSFSARKLDYYGQLNLNVMNVNEPIILQMLKGKGENVYRSYELSSDALLKLEYIYPGEYLFKVIYDRNENGKWDTGNLDENRQPEKVKYMDVPVDIRSNWEIDQSWNLSK